MSRLAVVGSYGVGMTMTVPRMPAEGETLFGHELSLGPGGKGSNQAIGAARLGAEVAFMTAVGPDAFGEEALVLWAEEGVDANTVKRATEATMTGFILVEPNGNNRICIASGALATFVPADLDPFAAVIAEADLLVTGLEIPVDTAVGALRLARAAGITTLLDPAPAARLPAEAWQLVDHLTPNRGEAAHLLDLPVDTPPDELLSGLRARTDAVLVLTLGGDGLLVDDGQQRDHVPPHQVIEVVDTTGAGDAFSAAYAVAIAEGATPLQAARYGAAAGAHAVGIAEVVPSLARRGDLPEPGRGAASEVTR